MDGVLVNYRDPCLAEMNEALYNPPPHLIEMAKQLYRDIEPPIVLGHIANGDNRCSGLARDFMMRLLEDKREFWANLPWTKYGSALFSFVNANYDTYILTKPMDQDGHKGSIYGKLDWISENLGPAWVRRTIFSHHKEDYAVDGDGTNILIDDYHKNTDKFSAAGGNTILYDKNNVDLLDVAAILEYVDGMPHEFVAL
jgi:hypothetical protein